MEFSGTRAKDSWQTAQVLLTSKDLGLTLEKGLISIRPDDTQRSISHTVLSRFGGRSEDYEVKFILF